MLLVVINVTLGLLDEVVLTFVHSSATEGGVGHVSMNFLDMPL